MMPLEGKPTDVLSTLPENIIDDILVRLPFKDIVMTSILSKNWRYKWCKLPELTLDKTLCTTKNGVGIIFHTSKFDEIISSILILHKGPITKCTFDISSSRGCSKIDDLISFLSRNGVQHLVLRLSWRIEPYYKLPSSLFTCLQLRHLTLKNCLIVLLPPAFKGFDRLIRLELCDVTISSELLGSLISRCLLLEHLVLVNIRVSTSNIIEINAPRLSSFHYEGDTRPLFFKDIPRLAKLSFSYCQYFARAGKINIAKFFEPFSALQHLHLDIASIQFFAAAGEGVPRRLPYDLKCVKHLYLSEIHLDELKVISCALCLIKSFSCLQYMEIKVRDVNGDIPALESLEVKAFSDVTFNHLTEVKLTGTIGSKPEMQLIKLLLAKSPVLVRMLIKPSWFVEEPTTIKIQAELTKFQRASPKAEVFYTLR